MQTARMIALAGLGYTALGVASQTSLALHPPSAPLEALREGLAVSGLLSALMASEWLLHAASASLRSRLEARAVDRRSEPRFPARGDAHLTLVTLSGEPPHRIVARVVDRSDSGLRVRPDGPSALLAPGTVALVEGQRHGLYRVVRQDADGTVALALAPAVR